MRSSEAPLVVPTVLRTYQESPRRAISDDRRSRIATQATPNACLAVSSPVVPRPRPTEPVAVTSGSLCPGAAKVQHPLSGTTGGETDREKPPDTSARQRYRALLV